MKSLRNVVLIFALTAMIPMQIFAQKTEVIRCYDEACVFDVMKNLRSADASAVDDARGKIVAMCDDAWKLGDSRISNSLRNSIIPYVEKFNDDAAVPLLIAQLHKICDYRDVEGIMFLAENESLADMVIRAIGEIDGTGSYIEEYVNENEGDLQNKGAWAYAIGKQKIVSMENKLIAWLKNADEPAKVDIYKALVVIRTNDKTTSIIKKGAKKLLKSKSSASRAAGLEIMSDLEGEKAMSLFYKALKDKTSEVRVTALNMMKPYVNQDIVKKVMSKCKKGDALADAINWLGDIKNDSYMPIIIEQLSSDNPKLVEASIRAIFKIDNRDGIAAVKPMFGGDYQKVIKESMLTYEGDYLTLINAYLHTGSTKQKLEALKIAECRPMVGMGERVRELTSYYNPEVRDLAFKILRLVVVPANAEYLRNLLQECDDKYVLDVQMAIKSAMKKATVEEKDYFVLMLKHTKPEIISRFYKIFAFFGTEVSVNKLIDAYHNGPDSEEAKMALYLVDNKEFTQRINEVLNIK